MAEFTAKKVFVYPRKDHVVGRTEGTNLMAAFNKISAFDSENLGGTKESDIKVVWDGMDAPLTISTEIQSAKSKEWMVRVMIPGIAIDTITLAQRLTD